ncbi:hypothetical protein HPP92_021007 [Vanilla planifolia]|uniref:Uncharacterized protein n=1 Tax=Vanilla planifolia TaxID=51239 RepID=A0A835PY15_VANPL|nr:hypothetical protein HPP92_021007 [Vanilla planifolia]
MKKGETSSRSSSSKWFITNSKVYKSLLVLLARRSYQRLEDIFNNEEGRGEAGRRQEGVESGGGAVGEAEVEKARFGHRENLVEAEECTSTLCCCSQGGGASKKGGSRPFWDRRIRRKDRQASLKAGDFEKRIVLHLYSSVIATR